MGVGVKNVSEILITVSPMLQSAGHCANSIGGLT